MRRTTFLSQDLNVISSLDMTSLTYLDGSMIIGPLPAITWKAPLVCGKLVS